MVDVIRDMKEFSAGELQQSFQCIGGCVDRARKFAEEGRWTQVGNVMERAADAVASVQSEIAVLTAADALLRIARAEQDRGAS